MTKVLKVPYDRHGNLMSFPEPQFSHYEALQAPVGGWRDGRYFKDEW